MGDVISELTDATSPWADSPLHRFVQSSGWEPQLGLPIGDRHVTCPGCAGVGFVPHRCPDCCGTGGLTVLPDDAKGYTLRENCQACRGTGWAELPTTCKRCRGQGILKGVRNEDDMRRELEERYRATGQELVLLRGEMPSHEEICAEEERQRAIRAQQDAQLSNEEFDKMLHDAVRSGLMTGREALAIAQRRAQRMEARNG